MNGVPGQAPAVVRVALTAATQPERRLPASSPYSCSVAGCHDRNCSGVQGPSATHFDDNWYAEGVGEVHGGSKGKARAVVRDKGGKPFGVEQNPMKRSVSPELRCQRAVHPNYLPSSSRPADHWIMDMAMIIEPSSRARSDTMGQQGAEMGLGASFKMGTTRIMPMSHPHLRQTAHTHPARLPPPPVSLTLTARFVGMD